MQVGTSVKMKDVAIACNLLHAPPLVSQEEVLNNIQHLPVTPLSNWMIPSQMKEDNKEDVQFMMYNSHESDE